MKIALTHAAILAVLAGSALGQDVKPDTQPAERMGPDGRRPLDGAPTKLGFKDVQVRDLISFIVEATGKVVMPQNDVMSRKITVINDREIPRDQALDLVFLALHQAGVGVVESEGVITLRDISEVIKTDVPVLGPDDSALARADLGSMAQKVYRLQNLTAKAVGDLLKDVIPDYAKLTIDEESNQIAVIGNIALLRRVERLLNSLDRPPSTELKSETFRLRWADASQVATQIRDLYSGQGTNRAQNRNQNQNQNQGFRWPGQGGEQSSAPSENLRVSANTQQNSVTVVAEPGILSQVREQIDKYWDKELGPEAASPKIYNLEYSDPIKVRDLLEGLFGRGTPAGTDTGQTGGGGGGGGGQQAARSTGPTQGVGRLAGQFSFQAMPESGRLVVVAKSPDNFDAIDKIIAEIDKPQTVGMPSIVELRHASSEDLAEQINTLLALDGTIASIRRSQSGLSEDPSSGSSPFAATDTATGAEADQQAQADTIAFWWQRSRPPTTASATSNLVGQVRIVPVWRQNAIMVMAPAEYRHSIVQLIQDLDKPGRQVLIAATVAEVSRDDATAFGLRWSSQLITPTKPDNSLSIGANTANTDNTFLNSLFDTSILNVNADLNVLLQALNEKANITILSEPRIFTGDNVEAEFFNGQDIPFITESQPNSNGDLVQSFDYKAVGIQLRVRPRITPKRDVDLRVNLELSSIVPGQTLFGGAIVDRRETTTQLIVQDGQTIVISGILRSELSDTVRKVPILGDIPLIKWLFRSVEKTNTQTELLVFITPVVIFNEVESDRLNSPYRQWLDAHRGKLDEKLKPPTELEPRGVGGDQTQPPEPAPPTPAAEPATNEPQPIRS